MFNCLKEKLKEYKSVVLGFSGGVDSSLLAYALRTQGIPCICVTVQTPLQSKRELARSAFFCKKYGIEHRIIDLDVLSIDSIRKNPFDRCYYCKKTIFSRLIQFAAEIGYTTVMDGSNADDLKEYRPGLKAKDELGIASPLAELGMTKEQIRSMAREQNLSIWDLPSSPCLASRIPYGTAIDEKMLRSVEKAEDILLNCGIKNVRVRAHGDIARIEAADKAAAYAALDKEIVSCIKACGFKFVCLDMDGYKRGCYD